MHTKQHNVNLKGKTFIFKIGNYKAFGGAETQSLILARHLKAEYDARIVFIADNDEGPVKKTYLKEGFETYMFNYRLHGTKFQKLQDSIRFIKFLRRFKPNFILPYTSDNCKKILNGWRLTGASYAWWNMQDEGRFLYKTKHEEKLLKGVTAIVSNSLVGSNFLTDNYNVRPDSILQYNNPITIPNASLTVPKWRNKLGLEPNAIVVSMIANLTPWKDHKTLFKAWKHILTHFKLNNQTCYLVLAGAEKETANALKILAFNLEIANSIKMLGSIKDTNALIIESDLIVHSSNKEGVPNVLCEAMALQKAVVATDIPGDREALTDTYQDYTLSEPNNPKDLADKIIYLLEHPQLKEEIGIYNFERVKAHYTTEHMLTVFLDSFKNESKAIN